MSNKNTRAARLLAKWRADGAPMTVTAHEAYRLTNGQHGAEGDHSTPIQLARLAKDMTK